ncbi:cupin domain-containing protein [Palleronia sediminis]|uniref:Cupin domain-containing protein n=1 Tax=Palleronia sediminis TaxID=2547833 RepID=A0A4R6AHG8_9RHOB|nr:cupin domain-containing protein [Palleronia sediminis]TDL81076.1 cupin domain-containing protein [Palleronia sediminis]
MSKDDDKPVVPYWHLYVDEDGISRQVECTMTEFELAAIQPGAQPQWQGTRHHDGMTVMVTVMPAGWVGEWHENPAPQWIVPLSGRWSVEAMDGTRREFGPGEISFGEDQGCREVDGRKGHRSATVGDAPATVMIVQFDTARGETTPCRFS